MGSGHLLLLLGRLEELIAKSPRFAGRVFLPYDEALEILKKIQVTLPSAVKAAEEILQKKERIIGEAKEEAERLLNRSNEEVQRILSEHHLTKLAQEKSNELKAQALSYAQQLEKDANLYVQEVLSRLEENLLEAIKVVHRAKEDYEPTKGREEADEENSEEE
ncbi:MAG TPA: hypothetical protein GXZ98_07735 [Firmicutes bacterium]|jgi:hypothetical protein|nr:hypothetical protein [Bacillota bacterium]